jgi:hypothetical protein
MEYLPLTEDEKKIKDDIAKSVGLTGEEETYLLDQVKKGGMSKDDLWDYVQDVRLRIFSEWQTRVEEALGFPLYKCTKIEIKSKAKDEPFNF